MRDKAKPPSLGLSSLSDKIKSLQTLIENSKRKYNEDIEDTDTPPSTSQSQKDTDSLKSIPQALDSTGFDWQNIELTNELGTDFRSTLTGVVPLKEGSITPDLDDADIPTLETVVFKPDPATVQRPPKERSIGADTTPELDSGIDEEPVTIPDRGPEPDPVVTNIAIPKDDSNEPARPEIAIQEAVSSFEPTPDPVPESDIAEPEDDLSISTPPEVTTQEVESSTEAESGSLLEPKSESYDADIAEPEDDLNIPTLTDSVISGGQYSLADNSEEFPVTAESSQPTDDDSYLDNMDENESILDSSTTISSEQTSSRNSPVQDSYLSTYSEITDEILLIIENRLREITGRTLHPDVLEAIHEDLHDLLRDWQEQLESKPD